VSSVAEALALLRTLEDLEEHVRRNPLDAIPWLPGQLAWLSDPGPAPKLYRAGVRSGKTTAACAEVIYRCLGRHPYHHVPCAPVRCAVITSDKQAQGVQIMRMFWELVPKHELVGGIEFSSRTGFRGHVPVVQFRNGSEVVWYSNASGPRALQGSEYDYIQIDEPPSREVFDECLARVRNTSGQVGITLTPLHLPVPWLQELCEEGVVTDHHYRLTAANQTSPITGEIRRTKTGIPWDEEFIRKLRKQVTGPDAGIQLDGDWETRSEGQWFDCFDEGRHVTSHFPSAELRWYMGVDYARADRDLGMCAVLVGVEEVEEEEGEHRPHMWVLDEVVMRGTATMEMFAARIRKMLSNYGFAWSDLDGVYGDNPVKSRHQISSNIELAKALSRKYRVPPHQLRPKLLSVKEGGGASGRMRRSKDLRSRWMYAQMAADRVRIHPRCRTLIDGLQSYDYSDKHKYKDITDAWMYGLKDLWTTTRARRSVPKIMLG